MMKYVPGSRGCFVCGSDNPISLKLKPYIKDNKVYAEFTPGMNLTGWEKVVHGGIISSLLDEVMVWAPWVEAGRFFFTGEMTVRFLKPLIAGTEITITAEVVKQGKRVSETKGEIVDADGTVYATATGKYIAMREEQQEEMKRMFTEA